MWIAALIALPASMGASVAARWTARLRSVEAAYVPSQRAMMVF